MEEIKDNERWKSDGNCKYCRRIKYCSKTCAAAKMRAYRIQGLILKLGLTTSQKIHNRNDALVALKAVDNQQEQKHTIEELDEFLRRLEKIAVTQKKRISNLVAAVAVHTALDHADLDTVISWLEKDQ